MPAELLPSVQSQAAPLIARRSYLDTGLLPMEEALREEMQSLQAKQKEAEAAGKYLVAKKCANQLREMRTTQIASMQSEIKKRHEDEWAQAEKAFVRDKVESEENWNDKLVKYDMACAAMTEDLRNKHSEQTEALRESLRVPEKGQMTRDLLHQRAVESSLVRIGEYDKAYKVKKNADALEQVAYDRTMVEFETSRQHKEAQRATRQATEMKSLEQRCERGRAELLAARQADAEKRERRYINIRAELTSMQRLEMTQLETFAEQQALAGKRDVPKALKREKVKAPRSNAVHASLTANEGSFPHYGRLPTPQVISPLAATSRSLRSVASVASVGKYY